MLGDFAAGKENEQMGKKGKEKTGKTTGKSSQHYDSNANYLAHARFDVLAFVRSCVCAFLHLCVQLCVRDFVHVVVHSGPGD